MNIVVINGTPVRGVTYFMKEQFLGHFPGSSVVEFYPKDLPPFCTGCKSCFLTGEQNCPHGPGVEAIWQAVLQADLLVFAYPVYALRAPASIKSLLDHFCVHWLVHRPEAKMFEKTAVVITNSVGAPNGAAQKDAITSLRWMGVSKILACGAGMMGDIFLEKMTAAHKTMLEQKMRRLARRVGRAELRAMGLRVRLLFALCKFQHKMALRGETQPSPDNQHYIDRGWIPGK